MAVIEDHSVLTSLAVKGQELLILFWSRVLRNSTKYNIHKTFLWTRKIFSTSRALQIFHEGNCHAKLYRGGGSFSCVFLSFSHATKTRYVWSPPSLSISHLDAMLNQVQAQDYIPLSKGEILSEHIWCWGEKLKRLNLQNRSWVRRGLGVVVGAIGFLWGARVWCFSALPTQLEFYTKSGLIWKKHKLNSVSVCSI
jgi:hypothetical protein